MSFDAWTPEESVELTTEIAGFTITEAFFATDARYNAGATPLLHWVGKDAEGKMYSSADFHPSWPCPNGWVSVDGGKTVRNPEGKPLRQSSWLGKLAAQVRDACTAAGKREILDGFSPWEASGYVGLTFDLETVEYDFGPGLGTKNRLMPVRFIAQGGGATNLAGTAHMAAPVPSAGPATATVDSGSMLDKVRAIAQANNSYEAFQAAALSLPGVTADPALLGRIVDREGGIWAELNR